MVDIITSESLFELWRREKYDKQLQKLDPEFFRKVIQYTEEKEAILEAQKSKGSIFSSEIEKTQRQLDSIKKITKELYELRENKLLFLALVSSRLNEKEDLSNMLEEEKRFYHDVLEILNSYRSNVLLNILSKKLPSLEEKPKSIKTDALKEEPEDNTKLIRMLHPVPKFVGEDLNIYGPFEEEEVCNLPRKAADVLISKSRAEEIKVESP